MRQNERDEGQANQRENGERSEQPNKQKFESVELLNMPSTSKAQHNLMAMVAHDKAAAKRLGIPQSVGKDYVKADKGRKFAEGGDMKESKAMMRKEVEFMQKKGAPKSMIKHEKAEAGMKRGGKVKKYAKGGSIDGIAKRGKTKGTMIKMNKGGMTC